MIDIEALREELVLVANVVGEHKAVAEATNNSVSYVRQIRNGNNVKINTEKNQQLIQRLINVYRRIGKVKIEELEKVL